ncbi:hypothetical protein BJX63DRAFT_303421 [Aspergillus granulosus]|uniref:Nephrocystin 3-like N-terminal domain-containing protein n=1 Tax=Aspergillus granulosus TaxID=176169 RepID=A0ABR4H7T6_9EURO
MRQIEKECRDKAEAREVLPAVNGSLQQITLLDKLIQETLPTPSDSRLRRMRKAVASIRREKVMVAILESLERYKSTLTLYLGQTSRTATARLCRSEEMHAEMTALQRQNMKMKCEMWLKPGTSCLYQPNLPGTCEWIWTEPEFTKWSKPSLDWGRLLCIYGVHGCGKSVLATSIAKGLRARKQPTLFFAFSGSDGNRQTLDSLARTLLWQLLEANTDQKALEIMDDLMHRGPITTSELVEALVNTANLETRPTYCIIDGVDECTDECNDPYRGLLKAVLDLIDKTNLHVVLLGRPYALQAAICTAPLKIEMNSNLIKTDIEEFIRFEIGQSRALATQDLRDITFEVLREKSDGMFLWAKLMIDELRRSATRHEVMDRLHNTPRGLKELFRVLFLRLVDKLDEFELVLARKALAFTITSCRALTVDELRYSYALDIGTVSTLEDYLLLQPEQRIMDVCGGLINFTGDHAHLIHVSVKEFLTRPEDDWSCIEDQKIKCFQVDLEATHRTLGSICVDYLVLGDYSCSLHGTDQFAELESQYPFLSYASRHAISHLIQSGPPGPMILGKINDFLESQRFAAWMEYLAMLLLDDFPNITFEYEIKMFASWLNKKDHEWKLFESRLRVIWNRELAIRKEKFGDDDTRTERWRQFLDMVADPESSSGSPDLSTAIHESPKGSSDTVSQIMNLINSHAILPVPRKLDMIIKLQSHLQRVHALSDPLRKLFEIILKMADRLPLPVLLIIGGFYERLGKLEDAMNVYYIALARSRSQERPVEFDILMSIASILGKQDNNTEAEEMYRRAVAGREQVLGKEHPHTLTSIHNLGSTLNDQGKYKQAEEMFRQAVAGQEQILGKEHRDTLTSTHDLGSALNDQGKYEQAEEMYRRAVAGREQVLGKENPHTLTSINNLGCALHSQGKYEQAEEMFRRAVAGREQVLGKENPHTLTSIHNLGSTLNDQGKYEQAEEMFRRAKE